jgi:hypothetical protein
MDQVKLAHRAVVRRNRLADFEAGIWQPNAKNLNAVRTALEAAGVMFLVSGGGHESWKT